MSEIVIDVQRLGGCSDVQYGAAAVEFAIGNELDPKADGIVVQADETNLALIKLRRIELEAIMSKLYPVTKRATPNLDRKIAVFFEMPLFRGKADLIVNVEQGREDHEKRVPCADEPPRVVKSLLGPRARLLSAALGRRSESEFERNVHVEHVPQIVDLEPTAVAGWTDPNHRFERRPVIKQTEFNNPMF